MNAIEQFDAIKAQHKFTVSVYFRGDWCPWCTAYLSDFNGEFVDTIRQKGGEVVAISSQQNSNLADNLDLSFPIINDPQNLLANKDGVFLTPKAETPFPDGDDYDAGMAQPAVIAKTDDDSTIYEWIILPSEMNFSGATDRPLVKDVQASITAVLSGDTASVVQKAKRTDMDYLQANHPAQFKLVQDYLASLA